MKITVIARVIPNWNISSPVTTEGDPTSSFSDHHTALNKIKCLLTVNRKIENRKRGRPELFKGIIMYVSMWVVWIRVALMWFMWKETLSARFPCCFLTKQSFHAKLITYKIYAKMWTDVVLHTLVLSAGLKNLLEEIIVCGPVKLHDSTSY